MSDGLPETAPVWVALTGVLGAALGAFGLWLANRMLGKAAFQTAINSGFRDLTDQLQEERNFFRHQLAAERVAWATERADLGGQIRNLTQALESLKQHLARNGIPVPLGHAHTPDPVTILPGEHQK